MSPDATKLSPFIGGHNGDDGERSIAFPKIAGVADLSPLGAGAPAVQRLQRTRILGNRRRFDRCRPNTWPQSGPNPAFAAES